MHEHKFKRNNPVFLCELKVRQLKPNDTHATKVEVVSNSSLFNPCASTDAYTINYNSQHHKVRKLFLRQPPKLEQIKQCVESGQPVPYVTEVINIACDDTVWKMFGYTEQLLSSIEGQLDYSAANLQRHKQMLNKCNSERIRLQTALVNFYSLPWWKRVWHAMLKSRIF